MSYYAKNPWEQPENPRCPSCDQCMMDNGRMGLRQAWICNNPDCENFPRLSSVAELALPALTQMHKLLKHLEEMENSTQRGKEIAAKNEEDDERDFPEPYKG